MHLTLVVSCSIAPVWEGTTGIQALDLLARKVMLQKLKPIHAHLGEVYKYAFDLAREVCCIVFHMRDLP